MDVLAQIWDALRSGTLPDLGNWSYLIFIALVFLEGPTVTLIAGAMAAAGILRVDLVFMLAILGNVLADAFWYSLGYFGGNRTLLYRFRWVRRHQPMIERFEASMKGEGTRMFLLTKLSAGMLAVPILISAGLGRVPWIRLLMVSVIVEPLWNGMLVLAGYRLTEYVSQLERGLRVGAFVAAAIILVVLIAMYRRIFRRIVEMTDPDL